MRVEKADEDMRPNNFLLKIQQGFTKVLIRLEYRVSPKACSLLVATSLATLVTLTN